MRDPPPHPDLKIGQSVLKWDAQVNYMNKNAVKRLKLGSDRLNYCFYFTYKQMSFHDAFKATIFFTNHVNRQEMFFVD